MAVGCCVSLVFGALPLVEVSCRSRVSKTYNMVASVEVTMYRDGPTGAAVDVIEHAAEGIGESACQFYGKVGSDCAHAFRVAAAAEHVSYDRCISALAPSGRSTAAGEFELLRSGSHLFGVSEISDGWLESDLRRASMDLRVCVSAQSHLQVIGAMTSSRSDLPAARHALSTQAVIVSTADV